MKGDNRGGRKWIAFRICGLPDTLCLIPESEVVWQLQREKEGEKRRLETKVETNELTVRVFMVHNDSEPGLTIITFLPRCESQMNTTPDFPRLFLCSSLASSCLQLHLPGGWGSQVRIRDSKKDSFKLHDKLDHYSRTALLVKEHL